MDRQLQAKRDALRSILKSAGQIVVAYSGGVDSSLLLRAALDDAGPLNVLAVTCASESLPQASLDAAVAAARAWGAEVRVVRTAELEDPAFAANPPERCYYCKRELCQSLQREALDRFGRVVMLADGNQSDDARDWRPGRRAASEAGVRSPLAEAGLDKEDVRALSRELGIQGAERPAEACLASRVPYGTRITAELLERIGAAEQVLREAGFSGFRVRHHDTVARIEVAPADIPRLAATGAAIARRIKATGYRYVALDLEGYRTGSLNEGLDKSGKLRTETGGRRSETSDG